MRLKPKRCSRRKVEYHSNGSSSTAPIDDEGGDQRDLVGERAGARRDRVAHRGVERVEAAEQRPAEQDGGAEATICQCAEAAPWRACSRRRV